VLFPNQVPPADPCEFGYIWPNHHELTTIDLESPVALLTSQLSSPGFSQNLGESIIASAGLDPESAPRVLQAIRESLPLLVQQLLQRPAASANSSSTSVPESSTTPGSSSGNNDFVAASFEDNMSGLQNGVRLSDPQASDHSWAPGPSSTYHNLPNSQSGRLMSQQRSSGLRTQAHVTNNHVRADATYPRIGAYTTNATRMTLSGRQPSSEFQVDSHDLLNRNGQSAAAPMAILPTYERRNITNSSTRASNMSVAVMAPPPPPQQAVHATTLKPRRSMDSGYASMHTVASGDGVLANPVTSNFALSDINEDLLLGTPSGTVTTNAAPNQGLVIFDKTDNSTENPSQNLGIFSMAEQVLTMPYDYSTVDAGFIGPAGDFSGLYLPSMGPMDQEPIPDLYGNHWK
jgi:hypothetical protein